MKGFRNYKCNKVTTSVSEMHCSV